MSTINPRRLLALTFFVLAGLVVCAFMVTSSAAFPGQGASGGHGQFSVEPEILDETPDLQPLLPKEVDSLMAEAAEGIRLQREAVEREAIVRPIVPECGWGDVRRPRADASPFKQMLQSGTSASLARLIARHPLFNTLDSPLCPDEWMALERLVESAHARTMKLYSAWRQARVHDNKLAIDRGLVTPWIAPPVTDTDLANHARALMRKAAREGETLKFDDALAWAKSNPAAVSPSVGQGHMRSGGKIYLHSAFSFWPTAEPMWDQVRFLAIEEMSLYVAWMQSRGKVVDIQGILKVVSDAGEMSMKDFFGTSSR